MLQTTFDPICDLYSVGVALFVNSEFDRLRAIYSRDRFTLFVSLFYGRNIAEINGLSRDICDNCRLKIFDFLKLVQPFYIIRDTRPDGGMRSLDFTAAPIAAIIDCSTR